MSIRLPRNENRIPTPTGLFVHDVRWSERSSPGTARRWRSGRPRNLMPILKLASLLAGLALAFVVLLSRHLAG